MFPTKPASTRKSLRGKIRANGSSARPSGVGEWLAVNAPPMVDGSRTRVDMTSPCGSLRTIRIAWQTAGSSNRTRTRSGASASEIHAGLPPGSIARVSIPSEPRGLRPFPTNQAARNPSCVPLARKAGALLKASVGASGQNANQYQGRVTMAGSSPRRHFPIRADGARDGSQISGQLGVAWATPKPVPVVGAMDFQVREKGEHGGHVGPMNRVRRLEQP